MALRSAASSHALHLALVALAALAVSAGTLGHGFVFDDHMLVGGNAPVIRGDGSLASAFTYRYWGAADEASPNELYRPVTIVSLALNARLTGPGPAGMHAGNVLLHALNASLVYLLARSLFGRAVLALLAALIFSVHPIATEAVAAVAGRADLLAAFALLAGSLVAVATCRRRRRSIVPGGVALSLLTFAGALSKETAFAAPLITVAVLGSDVLRHRGTRKEYREYLMTGATLVGLQVFVLSMALLLRYGILGYLYRTVPPAEPSSAYLAFVNNPILFAEPLARILTALRVAVMGAGLLVFPRRLSADYSFNEIVVSAGAGLAEIGALLFAAVYLALLLVSARRWPVVMFSLSWSALTYLIASNLLFPIGTIFGERLLYLPSIGFSLLVAAGMLRLGATGRRGRVIAVMLAAIVLTLYGARFVARAADWSSDERLFRAAVRTSPGSAKAHSNYGFTLQRAGRCEEAIVEYGKALEIAPGLTGSRISLGRCLMATGRAAEAVEQYRQVIATDPGISIAWSGLGLALEETGSTAEAESAFRKALEVSLGGNREAARGIARVMMTSGREEEAVGLLERIERTSPGAEGVREDLAQAHYQLGVRRLNEGRQDDFLAQMRAAVAADPGHGPALYNLALDALNRGDANGARELASAGLRAGYSFPPGFLEACGVSVPALTE